MEKGHSSREKEEKLKHNPNYAEPTARSHYILKRCESDWCCFPFLAAVGTRARAQATR